MGGPFSAHEALPMVYPGTSAGQGVVPLGWVPLVPSCQASFLMDVNYRGGGVGGWFRADSSSQVPRPTKS